MVKTENARLTKLQIRRRRQKTRYVKANKHVLFLNNKMNKQHRRGIQGMKIVR